MAMSTHDALSNIVIGMHDTVVPGPNPDQGKSWFPLPLPDKDPRIEGWFLLGNPAPIVTVLACYVYLVKVVGPALLKNHKGYELRPVILFYNAAMVLANIAISTRVIYYGFLTGHYPIILTPPDLSNHPITMTLLDVSWYYLILRLTECTETVLFVLRKKFKQVSNLHVFHHVCVTFSVYFYITYGGFSIACFELVFNALIHVIMYSYYFLSACGPSVQKYLWWKRYLTRIQLVQFIIMIVRNIVLVFWLNNRYSALPAFMLMQCFIFFCQFLHFYIMSYKRSGGNTVFKCGTWQGKNGNPDMLHNHSNGTTNGIKPQPDTSSTIGINDTNGTSGLTKRVTFENESVDRPQSESATAALNHEVVVNGKSTKQL